MGTQRAYPLGRYVLLFPGSNVPTRFRAYCSCLEFGVYSISYCTELLYISVLRCRLAMPGCLKTMRPPRKKK
jgi:hypothetical protein